MDTKSLAKLLGLPRLPEYLTEIDQLLRTSVAGTNTPLIQAVVRVINSGGKKLRSILVISGAAAQGRPVDRSILQIAAAIELIHLATLVHDDVLDNSDIRRGVPTINSKEGVNQAILAGDYLLSLGFLEASKVSKEVGCEVAATVARLCEGQSLEVADDYNQDRSLESYLAAIKGKTAAIMSTACKVGGLGGGLSEPQLNALARFGESFGLAFQLIDDVLDFTADPALSGKPGCADVRGGVYTLPLLLALRSPARPKVTSLLEQSPVPTDELLEILASSGAIEAALDEAGKHVTEAVSALQERKSSKTLEGLARLPGAYMEWALRQQLKI